MIKTPKGLRLHIGVFGRRNVGKSSVLNTLVKQQVSIVSEVAGTTTDVVEKVMEFKPIGPVVFIDTAGFDDIGALGEMRIAQSRKAIDRTEVALLVTDDWQDYEQKLLEEFKSRNIPAVVVCNKSDIRENSTLEKDADRAGAKLVASVSATSHIGIENLRKAIIDAAPAEFLSPQTILGDIVRPGELVVLVTPIDLEAPKGRLILPQVQTLRDILDHHAYAIVVTEEHLESALRRLKEPPALVVTDSQAFEAVSSVTPADVPLTGFSILFARFKGNLDELVKGAYAIDTLQPDNKVLIAEACTHHPVDGDIGREKIPKWLQEKTGSLDINIVAGRDFPDDIARYKLIIHCGSCMLNRKELLSRIEKARVADVPITNYGVAIAHLHGILDRAMEPFRINGQLS